MELIDHLDTRADSLEILSGFSEIVMDCDPNGGWWASVAGEVIGRFAISKSALDTLLNLLRIPIKYIERSVESGDAGVFLAESSINYWLEQHKHDFSFLVEGGTITQSFSGARLYLPAPTVNDYVIDYFNGKVEVQSFYVQDDIFNAVYLSKDTVEVDGVEMNIGVRVLFSDCFSITPRFDGVLYDAVTGAILCYPTVGRKFRVASNTIPQILDQIYDYITLSIESVKSTLAPALNGLSTETTPSEMVTALTSSLRLSKKVRDELLSPFEDERLPYDTIGVIVVLAKYVSEIHELTHIDVGMARDIQIALSFYATKGTFK